MMAECKKLPPVAAPGICDVWEAHWPAVSANDWCGGYETTGANEPDESVEAPR